MPSKEYDEGYRRGFADAIAQHAQSLPSTTDKLGLLEHAFINILLPGVGLLISLAESSREIHCDLDRGYIAGYRDGLQKLRNDRDYNNLAA